MRVLMADKVGIRTAARAKHGSDDIVVPKTPQESDRVAKTSYGYGYGELRCRSTT